MGNSLSLRVSNQLQGKIDVVQLDLSDLNSVKTAAEQIKTITENDAISYVICNAGVMACPQAQTAQGFEWQIGKPQCTSIWHFDLTLQCTLKLLQLPQKIFCLFETSRNNTGFGTSERKSHDSFNLIILAPASCLALLCIGLHGKSSQGHANQKICLLRTLSCWDCFTWPAGVNVFGHYQLVKLLEDKLKQQVKHALQSADLDSEHYPVLYSMALGMLDW